MEISSLLNKIKGGILTGLNVTIPYKQTVLSLIDELSPAASGIRAVNVLYSFDGKLHGDNTDSQAFVSDLEHKLPELSTSSKKALVLGGGGSARAVVYALSQNGWDIAISTRRADQAELLVSDLGLNNAQSIPLDEACISKLSHIDLIVNTTPAGMSPNMDECAWPSDLPLPTGAVIYDLIYNPVETSLMRKARLAGLTAFNGLGMLVEQAALSFERWTSAAAPREVMLKSALNCYGK